MKFFVLLGPLTLAATAVSAAIHTLSPSADKQLVSCTIETLVWNDDGASPQLHQIGMMDIVLLQAGNALRNLATVDALDMSAAVLLPCQLPAASDYYIDYIPHTTTIPPSSDVSVYRRVTHSSQHVLAPSSTPTSSLAHPQVARAFDLMTPAAPMSWQTASSSVTAQPTAPPTRAPMANRAVPLRELGVHPGLIVMWVGVMSSMLLL